MGWGLIIQDFVGKKDFKFNNSCHIEKRLHKAIQI